MAASSLTLVMSSAFCNSHAAASAGTFEEIVFEAAHTRIDEAMLNHLAVVRSRKECLLKGKVHVVRGMLSVRHRTVVDI